MSRIDLNIRGINDVIRALDPERITQDLDRITEAYTRKMANETAEAAPRDTGRLANSFPASVEKESECVWTYGSDLPYATRQEYEHRTKKGFVRKTVWTNRNPYREKIRERIREIGSDL